MENFVLLNMNIKSNVNVESWMTSLEQSSKKSTIVENRMAKFLRQFLVDVPCEDHEGKKWDIDLSPLTGSTPDIMLMHSSHSAYNVY